MLDVLGAALALLGAHAGPPLPACGPVRVLPVAPAALSPSSPVQSVEFGAATFLELSGLTARPAAWLSPDRQDCVVAFALEDSRVAAVASRDGGRSFRLYLSEPSPPGGGWAGFHVEADRSGLVVDQVWLANFDWRRRLHSSDLGYHWSVLPALPGRAAVRLDRKPSGAGPDPLAVRRLPLPALCFRLPLGRGVRLRLDAARLPLAGDAWGPCD